MARLGTADARFDSNTWHDVMDGRTTPGACDQEKKRQSAIPHRKTRVGEFHCIEPVPQTFAMLKEGREKIGLDDKNFVLTHAAISSRDGTVQFPDGVAGVESFGIDYCNKKNGTNTGTLSRIGETGMASDINCIEVATYSLDKYVAKYVRSKGPINTLQIDVEGFDFDVLFGAGSVLDRTYYLEFEHHIEGSWGQLHLQDAVKLLDGKGFTCYWAGKGGNIWRITKCYSEVYDGWHGWSNIVCVHRTHTKLAKRMEYRFSSTIALFGGPDLNDWCGTCSKGFCDEHMQFIVKNQKRTIRSAKLEIMRSGRCIKKI